MLARDDAAAEQQEEQQQIASPARPLAHPTHPARSLATQRSTDAEPSGCFYLLAKCGLTFLAPQGGTSRRRDSVASAFQASRHATPAVAPAAASRTRGVMPASGRWLTDDLTRTQAGPAGVYYCCCCCRSCVPFQAGIGPACSRCPRACWPEQRECAHHGRADRFGAFYLHSEMRPSQDRQ